MAITSSYNPGAYYKQQSTSSYKPSTYKAPTSTYIPKPAYVAPKPAYVAPKSTYTAPVTTYIPAPSTYTASVYKAPVTTYIPAPSTYTPPAYVAPNSTTSTYNPGEYYKQKDLESQARAEAAKKAAYVEPKPAYVAPKSAQTTNISKPTTTPTTPTATPQINSASDAEAYYNALNSTSGSTNSNSGNVKTAAENVSTNISTTSSSTAKTNVTVTPQVINNTTNVSSKVASPTTKSQTTPQIVPGAPTEYYDNMAGKVASDNKQVTTSSPKPITIQSTYNPGEYYKQKDLESQARANASLISLKTESSTNNSMNINGIKANSTHLNINSAYDAMEQLDFETAEKILSAIKNAMPKTELTKVSEDSKQKAETEEEIKNNILKYTELYNQYSKKGAYTAADEMSKLITKEQEKYQELFKSQIDSFKQQALDLEAKGGYLAADAINNHVENLEHQLHNFQKTTAEYQYKDKELLIGVNNYIEELGSDSEEILKKWDQSWGSYTLDQKAILLDELHDKTCIVKYDLLVKAGELEDKLDTQIVTNTWNDMTIDERKQIVNYYAEKLDIENEKSEKYCYYDTFKLVSKFTSDFAECVGDTVEGQCDWIGDKVDWADQHLPSITGAALAIPFSNLTGMSIEEAYNSVDDFADSFTKGVFEVPFKMAGGIISLPNTAVNMQLSYYDNDYKFSSELSEKLGIEYKIPYLSTPFFLKDTVVGVAKGIATDFNNNIIHGTAEQRGHAIGNFVGDALIGFGTSAAFSKGATVIDDVAKKADDVPLATNKLFDDVAKKADDVPLASNKIDDIIDIDAEKNTKYLEELGQAEIDAKKIVDDIDNHIDNGINKVDDIHSTDKINDVPKGAGKLDELLPNELNKLDLDDLETSLPEGWTYNANGSNGDNFVHIKDANNNYRIRIDPPDKTTDYRHMHLYDEAGNSLDINGKIVPYDSPEAHIPYNN